jgi:hypothetical protein
MKAIKFLAAALLMFSVTAGYAEGGKKRMKKHKCTEACTKEAHKYACGEKGHKCAADCHKKMDEKKSM